MKRAVSVATLCILSAGCSLHSKPQSGIQVKLNVPKAASAASTTLGKALTELASFAATAIPTAQPALSVLDCFAVNVWGGLVASSSTCGGEVKLGTADGAYSRIDTGFHFTLPVGESMTFEAYGFETGGAGCSGINTMAAAGDTFYKIGSVTSDGVDGHVAIPVSFDPDGAFTCDSSPYTVYYDAFDYTSGSLGAEPGWTACYSIGGSMPIASNAIATWSISSTNCYAPTTSTIDGTKPYTGISITSDMSGGGIGANVHTIILGVSTDVTSSSANGLGCSFDYSASSGINMNVTVGSFSSATFVPVGSTSGALAVPLTSRLLCEINSVGGGNVVVTASIYDSTGETLLQSFASSSIPENTAVTKGFVYANGNTSGFGTSATADDFLIEQADTAQ